MTRAADLFAGAGGFTTGAKMAGIDVVWAANHWPDAVEYHAANHPGTDHSCQDLQQANWLDVPSHDILLASPACQGHSKARGKEKSHHDALRSTAWAVVSCAEVHREQVLVVENVPEFLDWALYPIWEAALQKLGYSVSPHLLSPHNHGGAQERMRTYIVCTRSKNPIKLSIPEAPPIPANDVIEWDQHAWSPIDTKVQRTRERWARGRAQFGERFVMPYYKSGSGLTGRSIHRPIGTITTTDRWAVVSGDRMRMVKVSEAKRFMGFPTDYILPPTKTPAMKMLGNAVYPDLACKTLQAVERQA
jgi:DNA (cytosine-5)-methyltransferase 1